MKIKNHKSIVGLIQKIGLLCILFIGVLISSFSQTNKITVKTFYGFIFPHHEVIYSKVNSPIHSLELTYSKQLAKDSIWDHLYKNPEFGINLFYTSLGNNNVFGKEISLFPSLTFNLMKTEKIDFYSRFGLGISYNTETFDPKNNLENYAVSKPINIHFDFLLGVNYKLTPNFELKGGIKIGHFSNGNTSFPNMGMNYISSYLGAGYLFNQPTNENKHTSKPSVPKEQNFNLFASMGFRNNRIKTKPFTLSFLYQKSVSNKWMLGTGIEIFYDKYVEFELKRKKQEFLSYYNFNSGLFINQSLRYRKWLLSLQEGIYIMDNKLQNLAYFKASISYCILDNYYLRASLKTHSFTADYTEIGIGYKF